MALMLDHGLRVCEVALLTTADFDIETGELKFYRPKVDKIQTHKLTSRTLDAAKRYFEREAPPSDSVWRASASKADGKACTGMLTAQGLSALAITKRVETLGRMIGVEGLSAHDCRHHWATQAARSGTPIDRLQDAGGWSSPAMPLRYVESAKIANEGVKLT
jgi:integrase